MRYINFNVSTLLIYICFLLIVAKWLRFVISFVIIKLEQLLSLHEEPEKCKFNYF